MKFNFKIQQYQTDAVDAVVKVFNGLKESSLAVSFTIKSAIFVIKEK